MSECVWGESGCSVALNGTIWHCCWGGAGDCLRCKMLVCIMLCHFAAVRSLQVVPCRSGGGERRYPPYNYRYSRRDRGCIRRVNEAGDAGAIKLEREAFATGAKGRLTGGI